MYQIVFSVRMSFSDVLSVHVHKSLNLRGFEVGEEGFNFFPEASFTEPEFHQPWKHACIFPLTFRECSIVSAMETWKPHQNNVCHSWIVKYLRIIFAQGEHNPRQNSVPSSPLQNLKKTRLRSSRISGSF